MDRSRRIEIQERLLWGTEADPRLLGDLYLPGQTDAASNPAVVLVFGGGWRSGDRSQQKIYGLALAKAGFVCLATDYRLSPEAKWPAQLEDVKTAIRWLRAHSSELNVDPGRIAVSGNSSGGHLALMVAADAGESIPAPQDERAWDAYSSEVSAVCAFYPPTDLRGLDAESEDDTVASLMGADATAADYEGASPLVHGSNPFPPVLLIGARDDTRVPVRHTLELHEALVKAGNTVELHLFTGLGHAFDMDRELAQVCSTIMASFFLRYV